MPFRSIASKAGDKTTRCMFSVRGAGAPRPRTAAPLTLADAIAAKSWQNRVMNLAGTTLRLARQSDAPTLAAMSRDLIETGLGWHYRTERIGQLLGNADTVSLVAFENNRAGGVGLQKVRSESC